MTPEQEMESRAMSYAEDEPTGETMRIIRDVDVDITWKDWLTAGALAILIGAFIVLAFLFGPVPR